MLVIEVSVPLTDSELAATDEDVLSRTVASWGSVLGDDDIEFAVVIEIPQRDAFRPVVRSEGNTRSKRAIPVAEENVDVFCTGKTRDDQIGLAVAVEIANGDGIRVWAHGKRHRQPEGTAAAAEKHVYGGSGIGVIGDSEIQLAVSGSDRPRQRNKDASQAYRLR